MIRPDRIAKALPASRYIGARGLPTRTRRALPNVRRLAFPALVLACMALGAWAGLNAPSATATVAAKLESVR